MPVSRSVSPGLHRRAHRRRYGGPQDLGHAHPRPSRTSDLRAAAALTRRSAWAGMWSVPAEARSTAAERKRSSTPGMRSRCRLLGRVRDRGDHDSSRVGPPVCPTPRRSWARCAHVRVVSASTQTCMVLELSQVARCWAHRPASARDRCKCPQNPVLGAWPTAVLRDLPSHVPGHAYGAIASQRLTLTPLPISRLQGGVTPDRYGGGHRNRLEGCPGPRQRKWHRRMTLGLTRVPASGAAAPKVCRGQKHLPAPKVRQSAGRRSSAEDVILPSRRVIRGSSRTARVWS